MGVEDKVTKANSGTYVLLSRGVSAGPRRFILVSWSIDRLRAADDLVLVLHGLGGSARSFEPLKDVLSGLGVVVLAPDLPGHGLATRVGEEYLTVAGMARYMLQVIADHEDRFSRVHLVGHSLGGAVALHVVGASPIPVVSLVNVEGNLVSSDCGVSRAIAVAEPRYAVEVATATVRTLYSANGRKSFEAWADRFATMTAAQLHTTAVSLVAKSDTGELLDAFQHLAIPRIYVYGEDSANEDAVEQIGAIKQRDAGNIQRWAEPDAILGVVFYGNFKIIIQGEFFFVYDFRVFCNKFSQRLNQTHLHPLAP